MYSEEIVEFVSFGCHGNQSCQWISIGFGQFWKWIWYGIPVKFYQN